MENEAGFMAFIVLSGYLGQYRLQAFECLGVVDEQVGSEPAGVHPVFEVVAPS